MLRQLLKTSALVALAVVPAAAQADWRQFETPHFIVYSESAERDVVKLAEGLESVDGLMRLATSLRDDVDPVKVRIYHVASDNEVEKALGLNGSGVAGFYDNNILGPFAVTPRKTYFGHGNFTPELVLHHEYAHHFMLQYFPAIYPSWYVEGFAELIGSSTALPDGRIAYGMPAKHRGGEISANWVSLEELLLKPPEKIRNLDLYGQGWALTHFFTFSKTRAPQMRRYLAALGAGTPPAQAAQVFGDLGELNREAHHYLDAGSFEYRPLKITVKQPVIERTRAITPGEAALIPEVIAFRDDDLSSYRKESERAREKKLRGDNLARIREKAQRLPNDPYALYLLGEAEYVAGHYGAAEAAADRLLAIQPNHARAMVRKSLAMSQAAGRLTGAARADMAATARQLAVRASKADPNDPLPLLAYYESFKLAGSTPPKTAVNDLASVVATLPHNTGIRQLLVDELASQRRWAEAIAVLSSIANSTHQSPQRDAAREQMAKLQAEMAKQQGTSSS